MGETFLTSLISVSGNLRKGVPPTLLSEYGLTPIHEGLFSCKSTSQAVLAACEIFAFFKQIGSISICTGEHGPDLESRATNISLSISPNVIAACAATEAIASRSLPANLWFTELGNVSLRDFSREKLFAVQQLGASSSGVQFDGVRNRLPNHKSAFIGRQEELAEAIDLTKSLQWINITGPLGIGKSALCLTLAKTIESDFTDGVHWIDSRQHNSFDSFLRELGQSLGVSKNLGIEQIDQLIASISSSEILIVFDNCSLYRSEIGHLCSKLIRACQSLVVITTCISSFNKEGEFRMELEGLSLPPHLDEYSASHAEESDAVAFFLDQAEAKGKKIKLTSSSIRDITRICWKLGGSPLGIELVTNRISSYPLKTIVKELESILLAENVSSESPEKANLREAIRWSVASLNPEQVKAVARLSMFQSRFTLEGARKFTSSFDSSFESDIQMSTLVDLSFVEFSQETQTFAVNSLIKIHFQQQLASDPSAKGLRKEYMLVMNSLCLDIQALQRSQNEARDLLRIYEQDLQAVIRLSVEEPEIWQEIGDLVSRMFFNCWIDRQVPKEIEDLMKWMLEKTNPTPRMRSRVLVALASSNFREKNYAVSLRYLKLALDVVPRDIPMAYCHVLSNYAVTLTVMGEFDKALEIYDEMKPIMRKEASSIQLASVLNSEANCLLFKAAATALEMRSQLLIRAETLLDEAESLIESGSDFYLLQQLAHNRGDMALLRGNLEEAEEKFLAAINICCQGMIVHVAFQAIEQLADVALQRKVYRLAAIRLGNSVNHSVTYNVSRATRFQARFVEMMEEVRREIGAEETDKLLRIGADTDLVTLFQI